MNDNLNGLPSIAASQSPSQPTPALIDSNRFENCGYAFSAFASADARDNYWGYNSGPYHETTNPFGLGDTITGDVPFIPWLEDSSEDAGDRDPAIAQDFRLKSYPNPFNASVTFEFFAPREQIVSLDIFDLLGRRVESLLHDRLSAGPQSLTWNAQAQPSGFYFARLSGSALSSSITSKLLLIK